MTPPDTPLNRNTSLPPYRGRGATRQVPNRYDALHTDLDVDEEVERRGGQIATEVSVDASKSALSRNDSPDLPFRWSANPYRGCEHGCPYCYARPSHEYLGFSPGLDFETQIVAKPTLPALLSKQFQSTSWAPDLVVLSGITDPYQPVERSRRITRDTLAVFAAHRNPVAVITKNALVTRDLDHLRSLARVEAVHVTISLTTLRPDLARVMEPRASTPSARLNAIRLLAEAGIPVGVNIAPVIPGLTDEEIPAIVGAAADAGANRASHIIVRLPGPVATVFEEWLRTHRPDRADRILNRIREARAGRLNDPRFTHRFRSNGAYAQALSQSFRLAASRHGLETAFPTLSTRHFRHLRHGQVGLFDE
ncbi:MAG: PA0069 family radical SAM protein [Bacteroidota bacterium]